MAEKKIVLKNGNGDVLYPRVRVDNVVDSTGAAVTAATTEQVNAKQDTITGAATTVTSSNLTASRAVTSNSSGKLAVSTTTSTELGYVHGVTSAIQTQINTKQPSTMSAPIVVAGTSQTTVEGTLNALNTTIDGGSASNA